MRVWNTMVCAAACAACVTGSAMAQAAKVHPVIGDKLPLEVLNKDILALSNFERQAWINGAINTAFVVLHGHKPDSAQCMLAYYREADGHDVLAYVMEQRPDYSAASAIVAVANQVCEGLIPQS